MNHLTRKLLTLSLLKGVGPATLRKLAQISAFAEADITQLAAKVPKLSRTLAEPDAFERASTAAAEQCELAARHQVRILSMFDPDFPPLLSNSDASPILYMAGALPATQNGAVAIVGTRTPTQHGTLIAARISSDFAAHGWSVVSGLALGCDAAAHTACLDAGGHTIAVMAHGLQTVMPSQHRALADRILANGGAIVSEFPFGQEPHVPLFVRRDRTQAALAQGVVMVQSSLDGGSLHAARAALDYQRWLAVPYPTQRDRDSGDACIAANMVLAEGTPTQQCDLLKCDADALTSLTILRDKSGYAALRGNHQRACSAL